MILVNKLDLTLYLYVNNVVLKYPKIRFRTVLDFFLEWHWAPLGVVLMLHDKYITNQNIAYQ